MNKLLQTLIYGEVQPAMETRSVETPVSSVEYAFDSLIDELTAQADYVIPSVYRAMQFLADTVASLHLEAHYKRNGMKVVTTPRILADPNPAETYHDTMNLIMYSLLLRGNAYLIPRTYAATGEVTSLIVAHPDEVNVNWDRKKLFREYSWRDQPLDPGSDIVHIAINRMPGKETGIGPITAARFMLNGVKAEQNFAKRLFEDEATPGLVIKTPELLTGEEAAAILDEYEEAHRNRKRPALVSGGMSIEQVTLSPVDAEFLESRKFSVQEIARWFGLPSFFLGVEMGTSMTYQTTESLFRHFVTGTLNPTYLERIQQAFSRLLPRTMEAKFDTGELLKADQSQRYASYETALTAGWLTANEVRALEGLEPLDEEPALPVAEEATAE